MMSLPKGWAIMARKRKSSHNPNQLSLFDLMANHIEQIREENIQDDLLEETAARAANEPVEQTAPLAPQAKERDAETVSDKPARLGINSRGSEVFAMPDGSRMFVSIAGILNVVDGDHHSPEELYVRNKHDFLTIQEVAHFKNETNLVVEANDAGKGHKLSGNRRKGSKARNNQGSEVGGLFSQSLQNSGSLGAEPAGGTEETGGAGGDRLHDEIIRPAAGGDSGPEQRNSEAGGFEGDVGIGDIAEHGHRHEPENYRITPEDNLGSGGAKTKYADNIAAIRLLQKLEADGAEYATPDEQKILVRYVGWGGLPQVFDSRNEKWSDEYREMQTVLSPDRYAAARRSTQDAHYTSEKVIRGIYQGLERLGLKQDEPLRILEPSEGIGNFIGLCPENINARFVAVEQDPTSSVIAQFLYPKAKHTNNGFQNTPLKKDFFDAIVGNPPFGKQSLYDPEYPELKKFSIHNYFLAKSIELLREGGIAAFVVSRFFMDAADPSMREHIAQKADFLGAIRLPFTAFRQNALTDVTTDIVFFQKNSGEKKYSKEWINAESEFVENIKDGGLGKAVINSYFLQNPGQLTGKLVLDHGMYATTLNCVPEDDRFDLTEAISERLAILPENIFVPEFKPALVENKQDKNENFLKGKYFASLKKGAFCVEPRSGKIVLKTSSPFADDDYDYLPVKNESARRRLAGMIEIRDTLRALLNEEKSSGDESSLFTLRARLNSQYDTFVRRYGHLNSQTNRGLMREDPEHSLLESLEVDYDKGLSADAAKKQGRQPRPASATKADIFRKRVLKPAEIAQHADSAKDALLICLRETGRIDFGKMHTLLQRPGEDIQRELQHDGLIFQNPVTEQWEIREKYLSGNVREKLKVAEQYAQGDNRYAINVEALKAVQPAEIEAVDIGIKFGSTWVPAEVFSAFVEHLHDGNGYQEISYFPALARWYAKVRIWDEAIDSSVYGIPEYSASRIIESLLMNRPIKVEKESGSYDENGKPIMVIDQELTTAAGQKADEIKQAFLDWVWTDDERRQMLSKMYNERFNTNVPPSYDGSHLELVAASEAVKLRPHQKNAVWRAIQEGTALFDHVVGAGKTLACVATIMESKRMGFISKPIVVVPNHLLFQWKDEFYKLYPDANILVAEKTDFTKQNRQKLFAKIATNDWDAVIVAHSSFKKIDMPRDVQEDILQEQIQMVIDAIESAKLANGSRSTIKQLEKQKEKMETRYDLLVATAGKKDENVDFSDLGVDALFVDESHEFKNLCIQTSMNVSGLGNLAGSAKALDMFIKCRYLQMQNDGRGVYFMTGTPISNTIAEVYTLQRYLQYDELKEKEIGAFDAWASTFGQITNGWELDATGVNYRQSFHVHTWILTSILSYISISYLILAVQPSPLSPPCILHIFGYISGYNSKMIFLQLFL